MKVASKSTANASIKEGKILLKFHDSENISVYNTVYQEKKNRIKRKCPGNSWMKVTTV